MTKKYDVAVVGATGAVGEAMLSILEERNFPVNECLRFGKQSFRRKKIPFQR